MNGRTLDAVVFVIPVNKSPDADTTNHMVGQNNSRLDDALEDRQDVRSRANTGESSVIERHVMDDDCLHADPLEQASILDSIRSRSLHRFYLDELKSVQRRRMFDDSVVICKGQEIALNCPSIPTVQQSIESASSTLSDRVNLLHRSYAWSQDSQDHNDYLKKTQLPDSTMAKFYRRSDSVSIDFPTRNPAAESPTSTWVYWEEKIISTASLMTSHS